MLFTKIYFWSLANFEHIISGNMVWSLTSINSLWHYDSYGTQEHREWVKPYIGIRHTMTALHYDHWQFTVSNCPCIYAWTVFTENLTLNKVVDWHKWTLN